MTTQTKVWETRDYNTKTPPRFEDIGNGEVRITHDSKELVIIGLAELTDLRTFLSRVADDE